MISSGERYLISTELKQLMGSEETAGTHRQESWEATAQEVSGKIIEKNGVSMDDHICPMHDLENDTKSVIRIRI